MVVIQTEKGELSLPIVPPDFTYSDFIDIIKAAEKPNKKNYIKAVKVVAADHMAYLPYTVDNRKVSKWLTTHGRSIITHYDKQLSVLRIYSHIMDVITRYEKGGKLNDLTSITSVGGESFYFCPDDEKRSIHLNLTQTAKPEDLISEQIKKHTYTVGEVVEAKEVIRLISKKIEDDGDPHGEHEYSMNLRLCAILLRKQGEKLPANKLLRENFIADRMELFTALPMDVVLEVKFFFLAYISQVDSSSYGRLFFEGKPHVDLLQYGIQITPQESKAKSKAERRASALGQEMFKRIGLQFIFPMCLQNHLYKDFDEIFYKEYSHVIYSLAIKIMYD